MNAHCTNPDCSEHEIAKSMAALEPPLPTEIRCGECRRPCEIRETTE